MMDEPILLAARVSTGLMAGLYFAFAVAVMPALKGLDDAAFVDSMNRINVSIVNPILLVFFAAPVATIAAAVVVRGPLAYASAALAMITVLITVAVNVPLNDQLAAGGSRDDFENLWVLFNGIRTLTGIASFACLLLSRATAH